MTPINPITEVREALLDPDDEINAEAKKEEDQRWNTTEQMQAAAKDGREQYHDFADIADPNRRICVI